MSNLLIGTPLTGVHTATIRSIRKVPLHDVVFGMNNGYNFIDGFLYGKKIDATNHRIMVKKDYFNPISFIYKGNNYSFRGRDIIFVLDININGPNITLTKMYAFRKREFKVSATMLISPLPLPNIWPEKCEVCLGTMNRTLETNDIGEAIRVFIQDYWMTAFRSDLTSAINSANVENYMRNLTRISRNSRDFFSGEIEEFLDLNSKDAHPLNVFIKLEG